MGLSRQQVINDVLERYEAHLAAITDLSQADAGSAPMPPVDQTASVPPAEGRRSEHEDGKG